jgi:hypothetical protein
MPSAPPNRAGEVRARSVRAQNDGDVHDDGCFGCAASVILRISVEPRTSATRGKSTGLASPNSSAKVVDAPGAIQGNADVAQLVAHNLAKVGVASSSLVIRSSAGVLFRRDHGTWGQSTRWRGRAARHRPAKPFTRVRIPSPPRLKTEYACTGAIGAAVARFPDTEEVTGSIPVSRTTRSPPPRRGASCCPVGERASARRELEDGDHDGQWRSEHKAHAQRPRRAAEVGQHQHRGDDEQQDRPHPGRRSRPHRPGGARSSPRRPHARAAVRLRPGRASR